MQLFPILIGCPRKFAAIVKQTFSISGMTCSGCAATVKKSLTSVLNVEGVDIDLDTGVAEIAVTHHVPLSKLQKSLSSYPAYSITEWNGSRNQHLANPDIPVVQDSFWFDNRIWMRASLNTLNCLIGCSIGDFAMILFLQKNYPSTSMSAQMILATAAGLATSISMEAVLLKVKEKFRWSLALQTAFSMSFISMVAMELVMNATDFMITGGKAAFGNPLYWTALVIALVVGFLAPLPYNYYKLKKFNKACH
jgi:copper chaperone CopZ